MTFLKEISCHALSDRQNPTDMQRSLRILSISYLSYCFPLFLYFFLINPFVSSQLIHLSAISNLYLLLKSSNFILELSLALADMAEVMRPEKLDITNDTSSLASPELLHVLAVDDSMVDRKFIERLLRVSSCKGNCFFFVF